MDLFQQFKVIDLGATFGDNFWSFRNTYFVDLNASMPSHVKFPNWQPRKELASDFQSKVSMLTTSLLKKDYLDLPDIVKVQREVELSAEQQRMYKQMEKDYVAFLEDKECTAQLALTKSLRLMQIATGFVTMDDGEDHVFKTNPRIEELKQLVSEITSQGHKVIVWAHFRKNHEFIRKAMDDIKVDWVNYVGGMKTADQQEAIDRFQNDPNCKVFIGSQSAAGTGITLTAASYAIWYSRGYKYGDDHQSEGRFHRGGSEIHKSHQDRYGSSWYYRRNYS